jgi:hypothetical protein
MLEVRDLIWQKEWRVADKYRNRYYTVLRLALPRVSIREVIYEGVTLPKGTVFFLNAWACNMGKALLRPRSNIVTDLK